jgi:hypothetical protein
MNKLFKCSAAIVIFVLLAFPANAQQETSAPLVATQLALEITFLKGQPPSLYPVASQQARQSGGYSTRFGKVNGWQLPQGALPVKAVQVVSRMEGDIVRVQVSVLSGRESIEREEPVTIVEFSEGKQVTINELTKFGVEPIEIKLVKVVPRRTVLPQIVNQTESVLVSGIQVGTSTLPSYQLSLQNTSTRDIVAMEVTVVLSGKISTVMVRHGEQGAALIYAGKQYPLTISAAYQVRPSYGEKPPDFSRDHDCVIKSVIFRDGTYEGDKISAARLRAMIKAQQIYLPRVIALLQEALNSTDDGITLKQRLAAGLAALKTEVDESEVKLVFDEFPGLTPNAKTVLSQIMRGGFNGVSRTLREELDRFEKSQASHEKAAFRDWLLATKNKYEQWKSKL